MKLREGFISNSSSSSFIINKSDLTPFQILMVRCHKDIAIDLGLEYTNWSYEIRESTTHITGWTVMDNFDIREFFQIVGIPYNIISWGSYPFDLEEMNYLSSEEV